MYAFYTCLSRLFATHPPPAAPRRLVLILPCCIGDVVLATATLCALRRAYPDAHITWAVGGWSRGVLEHHPQVDALLDTGSMALPVRSPVGFARFVAQLRAGGFDLAVSLVRSPLMSAALLLSGIPHRAGLDSAGRGFGYTVRAVIDPERPRHEAQIYLDVVRALGQETRDCWANIPVREADADAVRDLLRSAGVNRRYLVIHPAGGRNPGMRLDSKRWPAENFGQLADRLAEALEAGVVVIGAKEDAPLVERVWSAMQTQPLTLAGVLTFGQIAALAQMSVVYVGNDTGLTHLAAATGARTAMIFGPTDPARYAPFAPQAIPLWKPVALSPGGVADGAPADWDWAHDGISVDEAARKIQVFLEDESFGW